MNQQSAHDSQPDISERAWQLFSLIIVVASVAAMVYTVLAMINALIYLVSIW